MRLIDLTGQKFGNLTVLEKTNERKNGEILWLCKCDCGNITKIRGRYLREGHTTSCGCKKKITAMNMGKAQFHDLTGQKFNYLTVLEKTNQKQGTNYIWKCQCDCGNIHYVPGADLVCGKIKSCGCQKLKTIGKTKEINMIGQKFGKLTVLRKNGKDSDGSINYLCKCDCGNFKTVNGCSLRAKTTTSCGCINYSIGEKNIANILKQNKIQFEKEYIFPDYPNARFDFVIFNKYHKPLRIIEFDGIQHYKKTNSLWEQSSSLEQRQLKDKEKNEYALSHNIPLVRIPYWERDNITLKKLLGDEFLIQ